MRPTSDKVREAVFSILRSVDGEQVLDLFAGTGAMGLESLSRGAAQATFVEIDRAACDIVRRNIDATVSSGSSATELVKGDAVRVLQTLAMAGRRFDLIFFDPPYERTADLLARTRDLLPGVCAGGARVVLELASRHEALCEKAVEAWSGKLVARRSYGDTTVAIIEVGEARSTAPADPDLDMAAVLVDDGEQA